MAETTFGDAVTWHPERPKYRPLRVVLAWLLSAAALLVAAALVPGVSVEGFGGALAAALVIAILNALLPPIIAALRLPLMALLGFVLVLVLDALMLLAVSEIRPEWITVDNFGWALLAALVAAAVTVVLDVVFGTNDDDTYTLQGRPADREAPGRRRTHGHAGDPLPRDRRPRAAGAPARDARRQRPEHGALDRGGHARDRRVGARPLVPDRRQPGGNPARLERRHPRVSLGRQADRPDHRLLGA